MMYITLDGTEHTTIANRLQPSYSLSTQDQIDAYDLEVAKTDKVLELKTDLRTFRGLAFMYQGNLPDVERFNLSEQSANYVKAKNDATWTGGNRYKFSNVAYAQQDFKDNPGFDNFSQAISAEEDRIMILYNNYRGEIASCTTVSEVNAIVIDFNP